MEDIKYFTCPLFQHACECSVYRKDGKYEIKVPLQWTNQQKELHREKFNHNIEKGYYEFV